MWKYFNKDVSFSEYEEAEKPSPDVDAHTLHEDFDELDEMMMGAASQKTPTFRQLHQPIKMLLVKKANKIDGLKINWGTPITQNWSLGHTWSLYPEKGDKGKKNPMMGMMQMDQRQSGYSLNAQYAHINEKNPQEPDMVIFANLESSGRLQTVFLYNFAKWAHFRLNYFFPTGNMEMAQRSLELDVDTHNAAHNFSMDAQTFSYNMVRTIGKNLNLGFEMYYATERNLCDLNYAAKYTHNKHSYFLDYSTAMKSYGLSYLLRLDAKTTLGTELTYNERSNETKSTFGYRKKFKGSEVKGWISSSGKLSTLFTLGAFPMNMVRLKLYAGGDVKKDIYDIGYGIFVGQET